MNSRRFTSAGIHKKCFPASEENFALVIFLTIAVSIAVSIFLSITVVPVFAILAVAIVGAGFALVHVDTVKQYAGVRQLAVLFQLVDELELTLAGVAGTTDVHTQISHTGDELGIGYHTNRSSVQNDVVKVLLHPLNGLFQGLTGN